MTFSGAVVAGGRSRRMGQDKAFIEVGGTPMIVGVVAALATAGAAAVRITGGDRARLEALGLTVDPDPAPFAGPLAALITSLDEARHDPVVVLACDLPSVSPAAIGTVLAALGAADAAVPTDGDRPQWLHGAWHRRSLPALRERYEAGERAIHRAVSGLDVHTVTGVPPEALADADTPSDLSRAAYPAAMDIAEVDVDELADRLDRGAPLVDVRQPQEYAEARVPGAVLIPLDQIPERLHELPDGDLHLICRTGGRSAKAAEFLATQGRDATNVAGGTVRWIESGRPVDRGAGST